MMDTKFLSASVAAGITLFILGFIFYAVLLMDFMGAQSMSADLWKETPDFVFLILGELLIGTAVTYVVGVLGGARDFMSGLKPGLVLGLLLALGISFSYYATSNMLTFTGWMVDSLVSLIRIGIAGGVAGLVMGKVGGGA
jgi:hypothetical protein